uniref:nascent polypeptide-associated complex subunit alpha, muscle-specific form-like n=1 Tax=Nyctereutes procyonoides TaxID=34880 RepID=UPI002444A7F1|nr:nascent polypeptide-associated complex subunit alpha, muscle-specific form-like [Nyctereutes procyonoides]
MPVPAPLALPRPPLPPAPESELGWGVLPARALTTGPPARRPSTQAAGITGLRSEVLGLTRGMGGSPGAGDVEGRVAIATSGPVKPGAPPLEAAGAPTLPAEPRQVPLGQVSTELPTTPLTAEAFAREGGALTRSAADLAGALPPKEKGRGGFLHTRGRGVLLRRASAAPPLPGLARSPGFRSPDTPR